MDLESPAPIGCYLGGFMEKQGGSQGGKKNWKKRYFVLTHDQLSYYTPKGEVKGFLALEKIESVNQVDVAKRPYSFVVVVDTTGDKKAKGETRELKIDAGTEEGRATWIHAIEALVRVYKANINRGLYDDWQNSLADKMFAVLEASSAYLINGYEFTRRCVNREAKAEFGTMNENIPSLTLNLLHTVAGAVRDGTYNTISKAVESVSEMDREISTTLGLWSRMNRSTTGYGAEVDQVPITLEGFEQAINSVRNPLVDFANDYVQKKASKEEAKAREEEYLAQQQNEIEKHRLEQEEAIRLEKEREQAEAENLAKQFEGREIDQEIYNLTSNIDELEIDDPNASILAALMDF